MRTLVIAKISYNYPKTNFQVHVPWAPGEIPYVDQNGKDAQWSDLVKNINHNTLLSKLEELSPFPHIFQKSPQSHKLLTKRFAALITRIRSVRPMSDLHRRIALNFLYILGS